MSFKKFKTLDIFIFCILALIFEILNHFASTHFDFKLVFMSYTIVLSMITIFRWGLSGIIVGIVGAITGCIVAKNVDYSVIISNVLGNAIGLIIPYFVFQIKIGKDTMIKNRFLIYAYFVCDFVLVILFRCLIISLFNISEFGVTFSTNFNSEIIAESMSFVISLVIILIASRKKGNIFMNMKQYVEEVQDNAKLGKLKEYKDSPQFNQDNPFTEEGQFDESALMDGGVLNKKQLKELEKMRKEKGDKK